MRVDIWIPKNLLELIDEYCKEHKLSRSAFYRIAAEDKLEITSSLKK